MSKVTKADKVRDIILTNINLVQNNQDDAVIALIEKHVGYSKKSDNKRAFNQQKDKVLAMYAGQVEEEAAVQVVNKNGTARKEVTKYKGKPTRANRARDIISQALTSGSPLGEACDQIEELVIEDYKNKGKFSEDKANYYRLISRNELERLTPKLQHNMGMQVSTPMELKLATRKRNWTRKVEV